MSASVIILGGYLFATILFLAFWCALARGAEIIAQRRNDASRDDADRVSVRNFHNSRGKL